MLVLFAMHAVATDFTASDRETSVRLDGHQARAAIWGLTPDEWQRYTEILRGPRGQWTPNLDPLTALGVHARTETERRRYAELLVALEFERAERELAFQRAYDAAAARLYPQLQPVTIAGDDGAPHNAAADRWAFIGSLDAAVCPRCETMIKTLLRRRTRRDIGLDIHLAGAPDTAAIRQWAARVGIAPTDVRADRITLNPRAAPLEGNRPQLLQRVAGRWLAWTWP